MARRANGFDITALLKYGDQLEQLGGSAAVNSAVENGMKGTKQEVNRQVTAAMQPGNLPAGGGYSTGQTMGKLHEELAVEWEGNIDRIKLGFKLEGAGITSIFLMYGTPKMQPAKGLREALKENPRKISRKEMEAAIKKIMERLGG